MSPPTSPKHPERDNKNGYGARLFNTLMAMYGMQSDVDLAKFLKIYPSTISRIRSGKQPLGAKNLILIHESTQLELSMLRGMLKGASPKVVRRPRAVEVAGASGGALPGSEGAATI